MHLVITRHAAARTQRAAIYEWHIFIEKKSQETSTLGTRKN